MASICCYLPEEVLVEILSWLPPESLIRFKGVSKSWYALINSLIKNPEFVNKHLRNIDNKIFSSTTCLIFSAPWEPECRSLLTSLTIFHGDNESDGVNCVCEVFHLETPPCKLNFFVTTLRSHCNGIICLVSFRQVILCNPAIKECRILPDPCLPYNGFVRLGIGFNYDSRANDYKIVRFGYNSNLRDQTGNFKMRAEVYSLRNDSWGEIGIHLNFGGLPSWNKEVFCKGIFYWLFETREYMIVSFDIFDEVFHGIPLPSNFQVEHNSHYIKLAVWNESLALFFSHRGREFTDTIEVWVMDDYYGGVKDSCSWNKKIIIGPLVDIRTPLIFLKNDELVMKSTDGCLMLYNLRSQMLRNITLSQAANRDPLLDFSYVKSLVSVQGGSQYHS